MTAWEKYLPEIVAIGRDVAAAGTGVGDMGMSGYVRTPPPAAGTELNGVWVACPHCRIGTAFITTASGTCNSCKRTVFAPTQLSAAPAQPPAAGTGTEPTSRLQTILREASDEYDRMEAARKDRYMRYAPAQPPATGVEALELLQAAFARLDSKYGRDWTEWQDVRDAIAGVVAYVSAEKDRVIAGLTERLSAAATLAEQKDILLEERIREIGELRQQLEASQRELAAVLDVAGRVEELERALRLEWWHNHGCQPIAMYGDDGEMQCAKCITDFKRMPFDDLRRKVTELRQTALAAALLGKEGK